MPATSNSLRETPGACSVTAIHRPSYSPASSSAACGASLADLRCAPAAAAAAPFGMTGATPHVPILRGLETQNALQPSQVGMGKRHEVLGVPRAQCRRGRVLILRRYVHNDFVHTASGLFLDGQELSGTVLGAQLATHAVGTDSVRCRVGRWRHPGMPDSSLPAKTRRDEEEPLACDAISACRQWDVGPAYRSASEDGGSHTPSQPGAHPTLEWSSSGTPLPVSLVAYRIERRSRIDAVRLSNNAYVGLRRVSTILRFARSGWGTTSNFTTCSGAAVGEGAGAGPVAEVAAVVAAAASGPEADASAAV